MKSTVTLYAPADSASHVCVDGLMVAVENGTVEVAGEQITTLMSHGFTTEAPAPAEPAQKKEAAAEKKARLAAEAGAAAATTDPVE